MKLLVDTNIIIYNFQKQSVFHKKAFEFLSTTEDRLYISCLTSFELFQEVSKKDESLLEEYLDSFEILSLNNAICCYAASLMKELKLTSPRRKIDILLASTALFYNLPFLTVNVKDFKKIKNLELVKLYEHPIGN